MRLMRVLVVEDDRKPAAFICKTLQAGGFVVDALNSGGEALASISRSSFDAVRLDLMLAGGDGLGVLRQCAPTPTAPPCCGSPMHLEHDQSNCR